MGIVNVNSYLIGKVVKCAIDGHVVTDNALAGRRGEKILLRQAQRFSFGMVIRRIQHLGNSFRVGILFNGFHILTLGK